MSNVETLQKAIETLECLQKERGIENGWLYEVDQGTLKRYPDEDPRVPLVQGGPDVMLMRTVKPMLASLRFSLEVAKSVPDFGNLTLDKIELDLARAIIGEEI